jgi:hypothetical protein
LGHVPVREMVDFSYGCSADGVCLQLVVLGECGASAVSPSTPSFAIFFYTLKVSPPK